MAEGLKIVVGADVKEAEAALKGFVNTAKSSGEEAGAALGKGLNKAIPAISNIPKQVKPARVAISHLGEDLETLQAKLLTRKSLINTAKTTTDIAFLRGEIIQLENEIKRVSAIGVPTFNNLSGAVNKAGFSFNKVAAGANNAFGVIRKIAFIVPGLGIAGIFGALFSVFSGLGSSGDEAAKSVEKVNDEVDAATKKQEAFQKAVDKAAGSILDQAAKLTDLRQILLSTSNATSVLTDATVKQGVARALFDQKNVALQGIVNAAIQKEILIRKQLNPFSEVGAFRVNPEVAALDRQIKQLQDLGQNTDLLRKRRAELAQIKTLEFTSEDDLQGINQLSQGLEGFFKKFLDEKDTKKKVDDVIADAKRLAAFLDRNTQFEVKFEVDETRSEAENKRAAIAFIQKAKRFVEQQTPEFNFKPLLRTEFKFINDGKFLQMIRDQAGIEATKTYKEVKKEFEENIKKLAENNPLIVATNLKLNIASKNRELRDQFNKNFFKGGELFNFPDNPTGADGKPLFSKMEEGANRAAAAIRQTLTPAFDNMFAAIKAGENPLKAFFDGIGQQIQQLIQKLIAAAVQAAILSALFPGGVGGAKGFGSIFKGILGFASGGLVTGPTLSLIGEGRGTSSTNPEVVAPLDRLRGMLAGLGSTQPQVVVINGRTRGNNFELLANRTRRQNGRLGG
jgi:hypothetical protein